MAGYPPKQIRLASLAESNPLEAVQCEQARYLRAYLRDVGATWFIEEPYYFDREYLSEFSAFYSTSARGYPNVCRRLHFFADPPLTHDQFLGVLGTSASEQNPLQERYLGFVVLRPIPGAPLGRTVLKHYPEHSPGTPRVTTPAREYRTHIAGLRFSIQGLVWAQQDAGVSACATIALWTMLHASAFDEHHAVPTTTDITISGHRTASQGARIFPSQGLTTSQIGEAIKEHGLQPLLVTAKREIEVKPAGFENSLRLRGFDPSFFICMCATLIRSGYPVIIGATVVKENNATSPPHAVCAVGFRSAAQLRVPSGAVVHEDSGVPCLYLHDDNIGPNVRYSLLDYHELAALAHHPPNSEPLVQRRLVPYALIVGLHEGVRLSIEDLYARSTRLAQRLSSHIAAQASNDGLNLEGLRLGIRIIRLRDYLGDGLDRVIHDAALRGRVRAMLMEQISPMSLHVGLVRIVMGDVVVLDVLHDTTDSKINASMFGYVSFDSTISWLIDKISARALGLGGEHIRAH